MQKIKKKKMNQWRSEIRYMMYIAMVAVDSQVVVCKVL